MKQKLKQILNWIKRELKKVLIWTIKKIPLMCFIGVMSFTIDYAIIKSTLVITDFFNDPAHQFTVAEVSVARASMEEEMPIKLWILNEAYKEDLDVEKVECILKNESNFNVNAININKNSADLGIFQWNTMHIKSGFISLSCVADYKCSFRKFAEKVKKDGNYSAWLAVSKCN